MRVDLNADMGESFGRWVLGDDDALLPAVTSANVACGFHAGDPTGLRRTCAHAATAGVVIGAQVSYRDLAGFGRRFMDVAPADLEADVLYQLGALDGVARPAGTRARYVKPHGALYNAAVTNEDQADAIVAAVRAYDPTLAVLGLPGSALLSCAEAAGLRAVAEGFADRAYRADGSLVPRDQPGAVLTDSSAVAERAVAMIRDGYVLSIGGERIELSAQSLCVHGDTPGAADLARAVGRRSPRPASRSRPSSGPDVSVLPYGDRALMVELPDLAAVLELDAALRLDPPPGVVDVVPAARTVLLRLDVGADLDGVRRRLELHLAPPAPASRPSMPPVPADPVAVGDLVEIPTVYDGPDLAEVAAGLGMSPAHLVRAHTGQDWTVAFCGFAPGFAYLTGADERLAAVPRRATPRTRVPAGSVALAGGFSAIYPGSSPGGWALLGRTDVAVFDVGRDPPALLRPGGRVRFVPR